MLINNETFISMIQVAFSKHAPATIRSYNDEIRFFCRHIKAKPLTQVTTLDASSYMHMLKQSVSCHDLKPLAPKTIKRKILTLYSIYEDAHSLDLVFENPFDKAARIAREIRTTYKREPRHIPFEDVSTIVSGATGLRNRAIFAILFGGGLRVSELVALKKSDVRNIGDLIGLHVITAKTLKPRPVMLPQWASKIVERYMCTHSKSWLFPNPTKGGVKPITRKWVSNLCYSTFGYRAHTARHTHISYLLSKGVPLVDVARAVGHESISSTLIYDKRILDFQSSKSCEADFFHKVVKSENSSCKENILGL